MNEDKKTLLFCVVLMPVIALALFGLADVAAEGETLEKIVSLEMLDDDNQVPESGIISWDETKLSRIWSSPSESSPGLVIYNNNSQYAFLDVWGAGGGFYHHFGDKLDYENQKWIGIGSGDVAEEAFIRQQVTGDQELVNLVIEFSDGAGSEMANHKFLTFRAVDGKIQLDTALDANGRIIEDLSAFTSNKSPYTYFALDGGNGPNISIRTKGVGDYAKPRLDISSGADKAQVTVSNADLIANEKICFSNNFCFAPSGSSVQLLNPQGQVVQSWQ